MFKTAEVSRTIDLRSLHVYCFSAELSVVPIFALLLNFRKSRDFFYEGDRYMLLEKTNSLLNVHTF